MAITGKQREELTIENVLKRLTEYEIYRHYLGQDFQIGASVRSPFREDKDPSLFIGNRGGFLHHSDLGDSKYKGNCIQLVEQLYSLNFNDALRRVDHDFGLGITGGESLKDYRKIVKEYKTPVLVEKKSPIIHVQSRRFDSTELAYWASFHISETMLKKHHVYAIKQLHLNRKRFPLKSTELAFGYLYEDKWKIYRPFGDKESKWMTNVPTSIMEGLSNIISCEKAIITKSKKDLMVLEQIFPTVCAVQSENTSTINTTNLAFLKENCQSIYTNFDCDEAGKRNSWYFTRDFGFKHINVPDEYYQQYRIKDFADLAKHFGIDEVIKCFKNKNLL